MKRVVFLALTSVCIAAFVFFTLGILETPARADTFIIQWIDNDDAGGLRVVTTQNGNVIQNMNVGSESYDGHYDLWYYPEKGTVLYSSFNLAFNNLFFRKGGLIPC